MADYRITGIATVGRVGGERDCLSVMTRPVRGVETWLYVDRWSGELVLAEQVDNGRWSELDLDLARERFADVLSRAWKEVTDVD